MDELNHGGQLDGRLIHLAAEFGAEQQQAGANPFPATFLQIFADLLDGTNRENGAGAQTPPRPERKSSLTRWKIS